MWRREGDREGKERERTERRESREKRRDKREKTECTGNTCTLDITWSWNSLKPSSSPLALWDACDEREGARGEEEGEEDEEDERDIKREDIL